MFLVMVVLVFQGKRFGMKGLHHDAATAVAAIVVLGCNEGIVPARLGAASSFNVVAATVVRGGSGGQPRFCRPVVLRRRDGRWKEEPCSFVVDGISKAVVVIVVMGISSFARRRWKMVVAELRVQIFFQYHKGAKGQTRNERTKRELHGSQTLFQLFDAVGQLMDKTSRQENPRSEEIPDRKEMSIHLYQLHGRSRTDKTDDCNCRSNEKLGGVLIVVSHGVRVVSLWKSRMLTVSM
jgi:hypothetical protein